MTPAQETCTPLEVAEALGMSDWAVRRDVRAGRIPNVSPNSRVKIPRRWLERRLAGEIVAPSAPGRVTVEIPEEAVPRLARVAHALADLTGDADDLALAARLDLTDAGVAS